MHLLHKFEDGFEVYFTSKDEGDARELIASGAVDAQLRNISPKSHLLQLVRQTHSRDVQVIDGTGNYVSDALEEADGVVTNNVLVVPGVLVADCAPISLVSNEGVFGTIHAGWRGIYGGVIDSAVLRMASLGAKNVKAYVGPCIKSECYEFADDDLADLSDRLGSEVRAVTSWGTSSLDIVAAIRAVFLRHGITDVSFSSVCTACHPDYFSYRAKKSGERHLMVLVDARESDDG